MTTARLGSVSLDCSDPHVLAEFYARLLGTDVAYDAEDFAAVHLDGLWLTMQRVAAHRAPTWPEGAIPQQVHLDLAVDDLEAAEAAAIAAGASKATVQPSPDRWRVLVDPAGLTFCLTTLIPE